MATLAPGSIGPNESDISAALGALPQLKAHLARHQQDPVIRLRAEAAEDGELVVPRAAVEMLAQILAHMAAGTGVSIMPLHAELTTQQAADMLNCSRPFLIGLLDAGEIDYRMVGTHRRVMLSSLVDYQRLDNERRRNAADDLTALSQEIGLD